MGIIDFRMRPLYGGYLSMAEAGTTDKFLTGLRCQITPSIRECSIELLVKEMDEAGIEKAVIPGRQSPEPLWTTRNCVTWQSSGPDGSFRSRSMIRCVLRRAWRKSAAS